MSSQEGEASWRQDAGTNVTSWVGKESVRGARGAPFTRGWSGRGHRRRRRRRGGARCGAGGAGAERGRVARSERRQAAGFARCGRSRGDRDRRRAAVVAVVVAAFLGKIGQAGRGAGGAGAERGCGLWRKRREAAGRACSGESRGDRDRRRAVVVVVVVAAVYVEGGVRRYLCTVGDAAQADVCVANVVEDSA